MGKCERLHQKTHGFSLVEMTVVLGLLAGAGVFIGNILVQGTKGQKKVSANLDFNIKMAEVLNVLQDSQYCGGSTNKVFKELLSNGSLKDAAISADYNLNPTTNTVNWIGFQVGTGAGTQNVKILQEGDVLENTYQISSITFQRQKAITGSIIAAQPNTPASGKTTHNVELVITALPTSGSGFPLNKTFKLALVTNTSGTTPTNTIAGCQSSGSTLPPSGGGSCVWAWGPPGVNAACSDGYFVQKIEQVMAAGLVTPPAIKVYCCPK